MTFFKPGPMMGLHHLKTHIFMAISDHPMVVMAPGQKFLGQPIYGLGLNFKNFYKNVKFSNFFHFSSKKIASGWVGKYSGQSRVSLLFTAGQK